MAGSVPEGVGRFAVKALCILTLHSEPKCRTGRAVINNSPPKPTTTRQGIWSSLSKCLKIRCWNFPVVLVEV